MKLQATTLLLLLALSAEAQNIRRQLQQGKRRSLLCLGIFRTCDDVEEDSEPVVTPDDSATSEAGSTFLDDINFPCLGLFRECDDSGSRLSIDELDCETGGIFGGKPLFGKCGVFNMLLDDAFNTTSFTDGEDSILNTTLNEVFNTTAIDEILADDGEDEVEDSDGV